MRNRFRILIVDDEDNILRSISRMLQDYSADTDTAIGNTQALNRFKQIPYDLAILDMNMPDFDGQPNKLAGIKLLEKLREIDPLLPIIILTGEDEATIKTMLKAKNLEIVDAFFKNSPGAGRELCQKVDDLLNESEVALRTAGETEPVFFKRKDILNLQGVVGKIEKKCEGQIFIKANEAVLPGLLDTPWLARAGYGPLREEPVDIIGVQDNKFVVIGSDKTVFVRDFYRNEILVHKNDLEGLVGEVVNVDERMKRHGVRITSSNAPEYLTSKKYWQAVTDDNTFLQIYTEVDILGERGERLSIRPHQTLIRNSKGQEVEVTKAQLGGLIGKVVHPIDEEEQGDILIISEEAPEILTEGGWQATSSEGIIFIPGERVEVLATKDKKLLVREYRGEN